MSSFRHSPMFARIEQNYDPTDSSRAADLAHIGLRVCSHAAALIQGNHGHDEQAHDAIMQYLSLLGALQNDVNSDDHVEGMQAYDELVALLPAAVPPGSGGPLDLTKGPADGQAKEEDVAPAEEACVESAATEAAP